MLYGITLLSFIFFLFSLISFFFFLVFLLCCLLLFIRFQSYLSFLLTIFFFFLFTTKLSHGYFSNFYSDLCIIATFFLNSVNRSFTWASSIQFSSYFVINNFMLFDFVFTFKPRTLVQNFKTYSIYICINLTIVVIFMHNIFAFVFI